MGHATATTTARSMTISRRGFALAAALFLGTVAPSVEATKNTKKKLGSIKVRVQAQQEICQIGGGTSTVSERPGGTTVTCVGGDYDGRVCTNSSKKKRCHQTFTNPPAPNAGGGAGVSPVMASTTAATRAGATKPAAVRMCHLEGALRLPVTRQPVIRSSNKHE